MNNGYHLISAIGTPLHPDASLHREGLRIHLEQQWRAGIDGVLVAGTMGLLPLLTDATFEALAEAAAEFAHGRGRLLVGVGDTSLERTRRRLRVVNRLPIDGAVAITPYFLRFTQDELHDYYTALADESAPPLYLYHVPAMTHATLEVRTVVALADHPNIAGIKCSLDPAWARAVRDATAEETFEVIVAQPTAVDRLMRAGMTRHLDGMFALAPAWTVAIADAAGRGDWVTAAAFQARLNDLLAVLKRWGIFPAFSALLNELGAPGNFAPAPSRRLGPQERAQMLQEPVVRELLERGPVAASVGVAARPVHGASPEIGG